MSASLVMRWPRKRFKATAPKYDRFLVLPDACPPSLYVVEFSDGWVKVGYTGQPTTRMRALSCDSIRERGADVTRFHVRIGSGGLAEERRFIAALCASGIWQVQRVEFFEGPFDRAVDILSSTTTTTTP